MLVINDFYNDFFYDLVGSFLLWWWLCVVCVCVVVCGVVYW